MRLLQVEFTSFGFPLAHQLLEHHEVDDASPVLLGRGTVRVIDQ